MVLAPLGFLASALILALAQPGDVGPQPAPVEPSAPTPPTEEPAAPAPPPEEPSAPTPPPEKPSAPTPPPEEPSAPTPPPEKPSAPTAPPEKPSAPTAPEGGRSPPRPAPAPEQRGADEEDTWIDVGHAFVEHRIFAPILRLDRFFSDERDLDAERSRSFLRWRNEVYVNEDTPRPVFATGLHANLRLPGLNQQLRRLRIVIAGETSDAIQNLFPRQPGVAPGQEEDTVGTAIAGLRFYVYDTLVSHADLGAGILTRLPPGAYGQVRFRAAIPVRKLFLTRSVLTGFWRTDTHLGTSAGIEFERPVTRALVTRLNGLGTVTEVSQGVEWASELALFAVIDSHSAAQLALAVNGASRPHLASDGVTRPPELTRFRLYTRLRRDVYRRWIFAELEPELAWPWTVERRRHSAWGATFRLEVQFQGREAPPPPEPLPPPEPEDPPPADALPK